MHEEAIAIILKYIKASLYEPGPNWTKHEFERRSYARWAAYELVELLMDRPQDSADLVIGGFILRMYSFARLSGPDKRMFIVAVDAADDMLSLLI